VVHELALVYWRISCALVVLVVSFSSLLVRVRYHIAPPCVRVVWCVLQHQAPAVTSGMLRCRLWLWLYWCVGVVVVVQQNELLLLLLLLLLCCNT
jgi:hypothetical protein